MPSGVSNAYPLSNLTIGRRRRAAGHVERAGGFFLGPEQLIAGLLPLLRRTIVGFSIRR